MKKIRTSRGVVLAGAVVLASVALTGCSSILFGAATGDASRDEAGAVQSEEKIDIFNLKVGDCKMEDVPGDIADTKVVPCAEPHDEEVYFEFTLEDGEYPGEEAVGVAADERCYEEFETFAGIPYEDSTLDFFPFTPTEQGWAEGDQVVQCVIWDPAGPVVGTLAGAAR